jgi:phosphomevalonate kinase
MKAMKAMKATRAMRRTILAPGKLMIAGEHTVLAPGGQALAVAVTPGIEVEAIPAAAWQLARADGGACWRWGQPPPGAELSFAHAALLEALAVVHTAPAHRLVLRQQPLPTRAGKPGLGGSAAAAAATAGAVLAMAGEARRETLLEIALRAHQKVQGGRGSGYDVATVVHGGAVIWRPGPPARARRVAWPSDLHLLAGYSGQSARTAALLRRVEARVTGGRCPPDELAAAAAALIAALEAGDTPRVLEGVTACHEALVAWDACHELGLVTEGIERLVAAATGAGAAAKVSGAGGGDSVIALASRPGVLEEVEAAWRALGCEPLPLALDAGGGVRERGPVTGAGGAPRR